MSGSVERYTGDGSDWDALVRRLDGGTFCHLHAWTRVIERSFGHECIPLAARSGTGALEGILPLVRVRTRLFGHYLVSMPFLSYGGPLGAAAAVGRLAGEASRLAERDRVKLLELRSRAELPVGLPASHRKITVLLDLPGTADELMKSFTSKLRSQVRRPFKDGLTVRHGPAELGPFYTVFSRHMRDLGTPVMPRRFFEEVAAGFGDDVWFGCAYVGGRPAAAGAGFVFRDEFEMTWASALPEYNRISANMGLYWAFMERCVERGLRRFNFGRCTPGAGTHRFKRQWGGVDTPLWWYQWSASEATGTPSPDDAGLAWGPKLWKRLPLPVANWLGPRIVRGIP